jgi:hypothetical protein
VRESDVMHVREFAVARRAALKVEVNVEAAA